MPKIITKLLFEAKKGDLLSLGEIYSIQGIAGERGFRWWSSRDENDQPDDSNSDDIIILRDIKIEIKVTEWE